MTVAASDVTAAWHDRNVCIIIILPVSGEINIINNNIIISLKSDEYLPMWSIPAAFQVKPRGS